VTEHLPVMMRAAAELVAAINAAYQLPVNAPCHVSWLRREADYLEKGEK
jgi:hypothetical protein